MFFFEQNWCKENYPGVGLCCYFLRRFLDGQLRGLTSLATEIGKKLVSR